jgi:hypothetical protein
MCRPLGKLRAISEIQFYCVSTIDLNEVKNWGTKNSEMVGMDKSQHKGDNPDVVKYLQQT